MNKSHYIEQIFGMTDLILFSIAYGFGLLGIALSILLHLNKRDKDSKTTPEKFSWLFFIKDNLQRIVTSLLLLFVGIRFAKEVVGQEVTMWVSLGIGLALDKVSEYLKNKSLTARR